MTMGKLFLPTAGPLIAEIIGTFKARIHRNLKNTYIHINKYNVCKILVTNDMLRT